MTEYDKLVRDEIPESIRQSDETPVTHVAEDFNADRLETLREEKADERGGFADRIVLERVK
ncbi:hypothetical protein [Halorussus lipolyticus]|uniref:hypothetical protein n=1 Tax=Halorussus lipolyticus TaxID=3034024 RepID=UPI0023E82819|nr:hypothetical protein [Halorussus sp. DT80]